MYRVTEYHFLISRAYVLFLVGNVILLGIGCADCWRVIFVYEDKV